MKHLKVQLKVVALLLCSWSVGAMSGELSLEQALELSV